MLQPQAAQYQQGASCIALVCLAKSSLRLAVITKKMIDLQMNSLQQKLATRIQHPVSSNQYPVSSNQL
jgi:hypothetical protein